MASTRHRAILTEGGYVLEEEEAIVTVVVAIWMTVALQEVAAREIHAIYFSLTRIHCPETSNT